MNSYMLSAIVTEITGKSLFEFCKERIFDPMGIKRVLWQSCPQSITLGGWGLFMRIEDMAKLGQMYLDNGMWNGQQIIPRQWVVESTALQIETDDESNRHYGYQIWINNDRHGSYSFNGMMGQNVFVYPDVDMVIVTNAGNSDVFQTSSMTMRIREMMKKIDVTDGALPDDPKARDVLDSVCKRLGTKTMDIPSITGGGWKYRQVSMTTGSCRKKTVVTGGRRHLPAADVTSLPGRDERSLINTFLKRLSGFKYDIDPSGVGIMPLMMQIVHNNFTDGMRSIGFRYTGDKAFYIDIYEGEVIYRLRCGFGGKTYPGDINVHGENYKVAVKSVCTRDEYNRITLRNDIYFLEETCIRSFNIYFEDESDDFEITCINSPLVPSRIEIRMSEMPGTDMLLNAIKKLSLTELAGFESVIVSRFLRGGMKEALEHAARNTMEPVLDGTIINPELIMPASGEKDAVM
jgi:hypothetical protein